MWSWNLRPECDLPKIFVKSPLKVSRIFKKPTRVLRLLRSTQAKPIETCSLPDSVNFHRASTTNFCGSQQKPSSTFMNKPKPLGSWYLLPTMVTFPRPTGLWTKVFRNPSRFLKGFRGFPHQNPSIPWTYRFRGHILPHMEQAMQTAET